MKIKLCCKTPKNPNDPSWCMLRKGHHENHSNLLKEWKRNE